MTRAADTQRSLCWTSTERGELDFEDMKFVNEQLRYGFKDDQLKDIITSVGGSNATTITADKFNRYIAKKVEHRKKMFG